jgi:hypothetical protein
MKRPYKSIQPFSIVLYGGYRPGVFVKIRMSVVMIDDDGQMTERRVSPETMVEVVAEPMETGLNYLVTYSQKPHK